MVLKCTILWIIAGVDFGTMNHTGKPWFAYVLIDAKVRKELIPSTTNFPIGTLEQVSAG